MLGGGEVGVHCLGAPRLSRLSRRECPRRRSSRPGARCVGRARVASGRSGVAFTSAGASRGRPAGAASGRGRLRFRRSLPLPFRSPRPGAREGPGRRGRTDLARRLRPAPLTLLGLPASAPARAPREASRDLRRGPVPGAGFKRDAGAEAVSRTGATGPARPRGPPPAFGARVGPAGRAGAIDA